jgi:hypothetical protein
MTSVIQLYGKSFNIGFSKSDDERRESYFKNSIGTLTPQEKSILLSLGIDERMEESLKPYLAKFFSSLQQCSSDISLVLNKDCETAYFVIWSTLFANGAEITRRFMGQRNDNEKMHDLDIAKSGALINGLKSKRKNIAFTPISEDEDDTIHKLFTLMHVSDAPDENTDEHNITDIRSLFTLMMVDSVER